jgi:hypothetical protein
VASVCRVVAAIVMSHPCHECHDYDRQPEDVKQLDPATSVAATDHPR